MDVKTLSIDLGKNVFHVVGLNEQHPLPCGPCRRRKPEGRRQFLGFVW